MMMANEAEAIIAAMRATAAAPPVPVTVPGWGTVFVRRITVAEIDAARKQTEPDDGAEFARGACRVMCDAAGQRLFDATNAEHVALLNAQPWELLQRVIAASRTGQADAAGN
jgi:hypothetical protein